LSRENVEVVRRCLDDYARGDFGAALQALSPDIEWKPLIPEIFRGREGVERFVRRWLGTWDECSSEIDSIIDAGEQVVVLARERGRGRGSGVTVNEPVGQLRTVRDQLVVRVEMYESHAQALEAAGLSE
jgi:ketosteroid isomerase-like protein